MKYETVEYIGFSEDQEGIPKAFPSSMIQAVRANGLEVNIITRRQITFCALVLVDGEIKAYWMPFYSEYKDFDQFARLIDFRHETKYCDEIMSEAFKWQIRQNHPDFPCQMEKGAWEIFDTTYALSA